MLAIITGGSASGKSEYAERLAVSLGGERVYIATMQPFDGECEQRILRHRAARAGRGFTTVECFRRLDSAQVPPDATVLLECLSNLVANELYSDFGAGRDTERAVLAALENLRQRARNLVVVTNEVFSDGEHYDPDTLHYLAVLGAINRRLAERADRVVEVVYTLPIVHKGVAE